MVLCYTNVVMMYLTSPSTAKRMVGRKKKKEKKNVCYFNVTCSEEFSPGNNLMLKVCAAVFKGSNLRHI